MPKYTISIDMGAGESFSSAWTGSAKRSLDIRDLTTETGGLMLVPMIGTCTHGHASTTLVSPSVIVNCDGGVWREMKCRKCRETVRMKPDFERMYGKKP